MANIMNSKPTINLTTTVDAKAHFNVIKKKADGTITYESDNFYNTVTDYGMRQIYGISVSGDGVNVFPNSNTYHKFRYLAIGSGQTRFDHESTGLNALQYRVDGQSGVKPANPARSSVLIGGVQYLKCETWYAFALGAVDDSFSEVGLFNGDNNTTMMCGQALRDEDNNSISIRVYPDEQLFIKYTMYWQMIRNGDTLATTTFGTNDEHELTLKCSKHFFNGAAVFWPTIGSNIYTHINGGNDSYTAAPTSSTILVFDNRVERTFTTNFPLLGHTSSVSSIGYTHWGSGNYKSLTANFDPPLPKTDKNVINLSFKWTLKWRD